MIFQRSVSCNHLSQYWYIDISTSPRCIGVCDCGESKVLFKIQHDDPLSVYRLPATVLLLIYWCLNNTKKKIPTFYHWLSDHDYDRCVQSLLQKWFPSCNTQSEDFFFFFFSSQCFDFSVRDLFFFHIFSPIWSWPVLTRQQLPTFFNLLPMLCHRAAEHTLRKALSALFSDGAVIDGGRTE